MTLAVLSILSIMLVAFVSTISSDRQSTQSYSQGMRAEEVANGGLAEIVGQLRAEIRDPLKSTVFNSVSGAASNSIYRPLVSSNAIPERMALGGLADPNLASIVKISIPGAPVYTASGTGGTNFASSSASTNRSYNGRAITSARWNKPALVAATVPFPVPNWICIGRAGPIADPAPSPSTLSNANAVLGRYAYVVYDTSGLLDINVAGYSPVDFPSSHAKGLAPWADLTQLGISVNDANALVKWRNAQSAQSAATYSAYVTNGGTNGFLQVQSGDTAFLSRQELLQYAKQYSTVSNALPYLTTFNRALNGPVWGPVTNLAAPYTYLLNQYKTTSASPANYNVFILNPRVQTAYTNDMGIARQKGEPLVKYRFPLSKLALLEKQNAGYVLTAQDKTEIHKYFGLDVDANPSAVGSLVPASKGLLRHWDYPVTTDAAYPHTAGRILTLDEVSQINPPRDPDFFELLQAGILFGSLGKRGRTDGAAIAAANSTADSDDVGAYQIIRIGANLIDQWDADSYPTTITFNSADFYGIEDLPYINQAIFKCSGTPDAAVNPASYAASLYFQLWNPHADQGNSAALRPGQFLLSPTKGDVYGYQITSITGAGRWYCWPTAASGAPHISSSNNNLSATASQGLVHFSAAASGYREPGLIPADNAHPSEVLGAPFFSTPIAGITLTNFFIPANNYPADVGTGTWPPPAVGAKVWLLQYIPSLIYRLQYQDPNTPGNYVTYSTFVSLDSNTAASPTGWIPSWWSPVYATSDLSYDGIAGVKVDPRAARWGAPVIEYDNPGSASSARYGGGTNSIMPSYAAATGGLSGYANIIGIYPFTPPAAAITVGNPPYRADLWAVNASSSPSGGGPSPLYKDKDGVMRPGDALNSYAGSNHRSPLFSNDPTRPVILNRPFNSVGEIGYAFRDMPWKTLDLFSAQSADAGLLDLFTMEAAPVVAGTVNPNTAPAAVLSSLLSGTVLSVAGAGAVTNTLSTNTASTMAALLHSAAASAAGLFLSRADLVAGFMTNSTVATSLSSDHSKIECEAVMRALAESSNTRTWNFLIDVIAQSGRYPASASSLDNFVVEGERRYWLHIAIDRYTGEIVDEQLEIVSE